MNKYHFNIRINIKDNNAGSKATLDCRDILVKEGFKDLELSFIKAAYLMPFNLVKLVFKLSSFFYTIRPASMLVVQYPLQGINSFFKYYVQLIKLKRCKVAAVIHDLDSLRSLDKKEKIKKEIDALSAYDAVISHNNSMTEWLRSNGYKGYVTQIELFDYLAKTSLKENGDTVTGKEQTSVVFAGNLSRGVFLHKLFQQASAFMLKLYGSGLNESLTAGNKLIKWYGSFSPEEIVDEISGDFGLVWDGDDVDNITGLAGNYLRYNTPHKTSLYLAAGIPAVVPQQAAISDFIIKHKVGICINSLADISDKASLVSNENYKEMRQNALEISERLRTGYFLKQAIGNIEDHFTLKSEMH